ncbi:purM [Symbiodinium necroappetens]|uniref:PurM protein n=1 Tax=Symbiodinium necroappetens TaxID=1628268 RepID=A0A813BU15_9DINO|nr:purM [Symbiodinium necroappetens]
MDFRRVESKYWKHALCWQAALTICLLSFLVYQIFAISTSASTPPVESTVEAWQGAGIWAVCGGTQLHAAGFTIFEGDRESRKEVEKTFPFQMNASVRPGTECSKIDLTELKWDTEVQLRLCGQSDSTGQSFYIWSNDRWKYVGHLHRKGEKALYSYRRSKHGWNYGYSSEAKEYHDLIEEDRWPADWTGPDGGCKHWTYFGTGRSTPGGVFVSIQTPVVPVSYKQGLLPQIFKLGGNIGGWWSVMTLAFCALFSKKDPDSPVAQIYEARTFVGERVLSKYPSSPPGIIPSTE